MESIAIGTIISRGTPIEVNENILRSYLIKSAYDKHELVQLNADALYRTKFVYRLDYHPERVHLLLDYLAGYTSDVSGIEYLLKYLEVDIDSATKEKNRLAREKLEQERKVAQDKLEKIVSSMKDSSFSYSALFTWIEDVPEEKVPKGNRIPINVRKPYVDSEIKRFNEEIYDERPDLDIARASMKKYINEKSTFSKIEGYYYFFPESLSKKDLDYILKTVYDDEFKTNCLEFYKQPANYQRGDRIYQFKIADIVYDYESKMIGFCKGYKRIE
ncbi:MAG: hypothetical protein Hyperionvirus27_26 [Hyperionvirus sp.]|uniref:Uncharacterized protein n=1 Tax=Hyperionvirus sp. TaxID=2487770 RepID=A0A3G5AB98_9VIRU|nr:MAG: hypothetical protein Hyperionvirus27_26 [Hyperionvirus sp.]